MVNKRLFAIFLIFLLLFPRKANSIGIVYSIIGGATAICWVVGAISRFNKWKSQLDNLQEGVDKVDEKVTEVDKKVTELQGSINNFDKKTDENFIEVKSEVLETKFILLNELSNKEKVLSDAIKKTEENIKQESHENYENLGKQLEIIKLDIKTLATKEGVNDLKESAKLIERQIENLRKDFDIYMQKIEINMQKSELRLKENFNQHFEDNSNKIGTDIEKKLESKISVLRLALERIERKQTESDLQAKNIYNEVEQIGRDVCVVKSIIIGKRPAVI